MEQYENKELKTEEKEKRGRKRPFVSLDICRYLLLGCIKVFVFDEQENNVLIYMRPDIDDMDLMTEPKQFFTLPYEDIEVLKQMAEDPILRRKQEDPVRLYMEVGLMMDGTGSTLTVYDNNRRRELTYDNIDMYRDHLEGYPQMQAALKLMDKMREVILKNTGMDVDFK